MQGTETVTSPAPQVPLDPSRFLWGSIDRSWVLKHEYVGTASQ